MHSADRSSRRGGLCVYRVALLEGSGSIQLGSIHDPSFGTAVASFRVLQESAYGDVHVNSESCIP